MIKKLWRSKLPSLRQVHCQDNSQRVMDDRNISPFDHQRRESSKLRNNLQQLGLNDETKRKIKVQNEENMEKNQQQKTEEKEEPENLPCKEIEAIIICVLVVIFLAIIPILVVLLKGIVEIHVEPEEDVIVSRTFQNNHVYHLQYTINTEMENSDVRINYTAFYVVKQATENKTDFMAVLQKRSEEKIDESGTESQIYDDSTTFETILKYGSQSLLMNENIQNISDLDDLADLNSNFSIDGNSSNQSKSFAPVLPVFRFSLLKNGTIQSFTFPNDLDEETLGLLRSFVKLFSPLLDTSLYKNKQTRRKVKVDPESEYEEEENYDYETSASETTLKNNGKSSSSGDSHRSNETTESESKFTDTGELKESTVNAETNFDTEYEEPNENYSTHNFDLSFSTQQRAHLEVLESFSAQEEYVKEFQNFIVSYEEANETSTMTVEELINHVLGKDSSEGQAEPGDVRLLLEEDGSLSLMKYGKEVKILSTNVLGFKIKLYGFTRLRLNLYQDPQNQYKKNPKFLADIGTIMKLGYKKYEIPLVWVQKQLPPLTLKYTLDQVEGVIELIKGDFIQKVIDLSKMIINGEFDDNLVPNLLQVGNLMGDLNNAVSTQSEERAPNSTLSTIYSSVINIKEIFETKGLDLMNPNNDLAVDVSSQVFSYVNVSFEDALNIFNAAKGTLNAIRENGSDFLQNSLSDYKNANISEIAEIIKNLVPPQILQAYEQEIQKAFQIINYIEYVRDKGLEYKSMLESINSGNKEDMIGFIGGTIQLFFDNQTSIVSPIFSNISTRISQVQNQINNIKSNLMSFSPMDTKIINYFNTLINNNLKTTGYSNKFTEILDLLSTSASGIDGEKGDCCQWEQVWYTLGIQKKCVNHNDARDDQTVENSNFLVFRDIVENWFNDMANSAETFMNTATTIVNNNNGINDKFNSLQIEAASVFNSGIEDILVKIAQIKNRAIDIRSRVQCGGTDNLDSYIVKLQEIETLATTFKTNLDNFLSIKNNVFSSFKTNVYTQIINNFAVVPSIDSFLSQYEEIQEQSKTLISNLNQFTTDFQVSSFISDLVSFTNNLQTMYDLIGDSLQQQCLSKQSNMATINSIRQDYASKLNSANSLPNSFLDTELNQLKSFLNLTQETAFSVYDGIPFCEISNSYKQLIKQLPAQFENFQVLIDLHNKLEKIWKHGEDTLSELKEDVLGLKDNFFDLFSEQQYFTFLDKVEEGSKKFNDLVKNISLQVSILKDLMGEAEVFKFTSLQNLQGKIQIFTNTTFDLSSTKMFTDINPMKSQALATIKDIGFDIMAVIASARKVTNYFNETVSNVEMGVGLVKDEFKDLCQNFIDLTTNVNQEYLNQINDNFRNIINIVNTTIFPSLISGYENIKNEFEGFQFKNPEMRNLYQNSMNSMERFLNISTNTKNVVFTQMKDFTDRTIDLINKLEIGNINLLYQLGKYIGQEFKIFIDKFPSLAREILNFQDYVNNDFSILFKFGDIVNDIKGKIENTYKNTTNNIGNKINETFSELEQNSAFYNKFKNSSVFQNISTFFNDVAIDFEGYFENANGNITLIQGYIDTLSGDVGIIMETLSRIKNTVKDAKAKTETRIVNVKAEFINIKKKFDSLEKLIFTAINADFGDKVMSSVNYITEELDSIVYDDLGSILNVVDETLPSSLTHIKVMIQNIETLYGNVVELRDGYIEKLENFTEKVDEFLEDHVSEKMQKLKTGLLHIKSETDLEQPNPGFVLYEKELDSYQAPFFRYPNNQVQQVIVTAIGTFVMSIEINFTLTLSAKISLHQFRDIRIGANFSAALVMRVQFGYGICNIIEFGLFVDGNLVRADLEPAFYMKNVLPVQLVKALADVPEISETNLIQIFFHIDFALYAVELDIGFYIKYITIKIIWKEFKKCFWGFCIGFKLPIGFTFGYDIKSTGWKIAGKALMKKRLLDLKLLEFKLF